MKVAAPVGVVAVVCTEAGHAGHGKIDRKCDGRLTLASKRVHQVDGSVLEDRIGRNGHRNEDIVVGDRCRGVGGLPDGDPEPAETVSTTVSSGSKVVSATGAMVTRAVLLPGAKVTVPAVVEKVAAPVCV